MAPHNPLNDVAAEAFEIGTPQFCQIGPNSDSFSCKRVASARARAIRLHRVTVVSYRSSGAIDACAAVLGAAPGLAYGSRSGPRPVRPRWVAFPCQRGARIPFWPVNTLLSYSRNPTFGRVFEHA